MKEPETNSWWLRLDLIMCFYDDCKLGLQCAYSNCSHALFGWWINFDIKDLFADSARDKEIGTGKLQVPPQEQVINKKLGEDQGNEALSSKSNPSDSLPSISTSDPAVSASISLVSNSAGKSGVSYNKEEFDNKETCVDGSTVSVSQNDINCGTSEDPQSSKEPSDDDPLNSVSELSYRTDNLKASEDTQSLPVCDRNSVETGKHQLLENANIQVASAVVPSPLPGEIGNYGCSSEDEVDKIIDSSGNSNLNSPSVLVRLSEGETSNSISGTTKSTEDESGKVAVNEHKNNIPVEPASTADVHVDFSAIATSTMSVPVRTTIEEVCTEPGSVSPAAVLPSALGSSDIGVGSEQGANTSSLRASGDASTNSMAVASSNKEDPDIFPVPSVQATEEDIVDPSAGEAPKGRLLFSCGT